MLYKALKSFAGSKISMRRNETKEIKDTALADNLLKAGYIEPIDDKPKGSRSSNKNTKVKEAIDND